jgi:hypothetical protein
LAPGLAALSSATGGTCVVLKGEKRHVLYRYRTVTYIAVLCPTVPYRSLLYRTVPYCAPLCNGNPHSITELYRTVPYCNTVAHLATPRNIPLLYIGTRAYYFQSTVTVLVLEVNLLDRPFGSLLPSEWGLGFLPWLSMTSPRVSVLYCQSPGSEVQSPKSGVQSLKSKVQSPKIKIPESGVHLDLLPFFRYSRTGSAMVSPLFFTLFFSGLQVRAVRCLEARAARCLEVHTGRCPRTSNRCS